MLKKLTSIILAAVSMIAFTSVTHATKVGTVIGTVYNTDIVAYINNYAIPSYAANGTSVVVAEDLRNFGFDVEWNHFERTLSISRNENIQPYEMEFEKNGVPSGKFTDLLHTDIKVFANGVQIPSYAINGYTMIPLESLTMFGPYTWVSEQRALKLWVDGVHIRSEMQEIPQTWNAPISWRNMIGQYDGDDLNCIYLDNIDGEPYLTIATYKGGDDLDGPLYVNDNGSLFYFNGGTRSFTIRFIDHNTIELYNDTWNRSLEGIYEKNQFHVAEPISIKVTSKNDAIAIIKEHLSMLEEIEDPEDWYDDFDHFEAYEYTNHYEVWASYGGNYNIDYIVYRVEKNDRYDITIIGNY